MKKAKAYALVMAAVLVSVLCACQKTLQNNMSVTTAIKRDAEMAKQTKEIIPEMERTKSAKPAETTSTAQTLEAEQTVQDDSKIQNNAGLKRPNAIVLDVLGDSITYGEGVSNQENTYVNRIAKQLNVKEVHNYGLRGSLIAGDHPDRFVDRYKNMDTTANLILVFGGTNDVSDETGPTALGTIDDQSTDTFYGGVAALMQGLKETYPNAQIVFMTPLKRTDYQKKNKLGKTEADYVEAIVELGQKYNVSVLNLYAESNLDFTMDKANYMYDSIHPNARAHKVLANYIAEHLFAE